MVVVVVVVVVGFIHCDLKQGYFYIDYSIERWFLNACYEKSQWGLQVHVIKNIKCAFMACNLHGILIVTCCTSHTAPNHWDTFTAQHKYHHPKLVFTLPTPSAPFYTLSHLCLCPKKTKPSSLFLCDVIYNFSYFFIYFRRNFLSISIEELQRATASDSEMKRLLGD